MKLLLTSAGISNTSIRNALVDLLGKPIEESTALFIPTALHAINNGEYIVRKVICGTLDPFCELGWKSVGLLELTALPTLKKEFWMARLEKADALLVGGGDCQYLCYWMQQSGLAEFLPSLRRRRCSIIISQASINPRTRRRLVSDQRPT
ncbi:MAG TPA: Type 1 glutamine amidotransferase-like domain-containing protein [Ferruginibacter sp.]|nr:Type 1 glutamine amidotransferase-like domain-containing protein [Ferruginibacter sp.]